MESRGKGPFPPACNMDLVKVVVLGWLVMIGRPAGSEKPTPDISTRRADSGAPDVAERAVAKSRVFRPGTNLFVIVKLAGFFPEPEFAEELINPVDCPLIKMSFPNSLAYQTPDNVTGWFRSTESRRNVVR